MLVYYFEHEKVMDMKSLGNVSVVIFVISILSYGGWFFEESMFSRSIIILLSVVLPAIGLVTAFLSKRGVLRIVGIIGNITVLMFSVILPAVSMLFWNQP